MLEVVLVRLDRALLLVDDLAGALDIVLASLATLLFEGCRVRLLDAEGLLGRDSRSVTAAAVALTLDFMLEAMVGLVGRLVAEVVEESTLLLPVDLRDEVVT